MWEELRRAVRKGDVARAKWITQWLWDNEWRKIETAYRLAEVLIEEGRANVYGAKKELVVWEGIHVERGCFPKLRID